MNDCQARLNKKWITRNDPFLYVNTNLVGDWPKSRRGSHVKTQTPYGLALVPRGLRYKEENVNPIIRSKLSTR